MSREINDSLRSSLRARSDFLAAIRSYFSAQDVLEVETPLLRSYTASDPNISSLALAPSIYPSKLRFLQTSPEAALKRLLAEGSGSIFQLGKVFRDDPAGRWHRQEFTMLEWYRVGYRLEQLMDDVAALLTSVGIDCAAPETASYRQLFLDCLSIDPFSATLEDLQSMARSRVDLAFQSDTKDDWLDLLFTHCIQDHLGLEAPIFVIDYPPSQAALAAIERDPAGGLIARRAELFWRGVELANAYQELVDEREFEQRYERDIQLRRAAGKREPVIDKDLSDAMSQGLPDCAGVALGVDRLFALVSGSNAIESGLFD